MFNLRQVDIWIAIVDQFVEELHGFPNTHRAAIKRQVLGAFLSIERQCLILVVEAIKFLDTRPGLRSIVAKFVRLLHLFLGGCHKRICLGWLRITPQQVIFPFIKAI